MVRVRLLPPGEGTGEATILEALCPMGEQSAPPQFCRQPMLRGCQCDATTRIQSEAGLGIATVITVPHLQAGGESSAHDPPEGGAHHHGITLAHEGQAVAAASHSLRSAIVRATTLGCQGEFTTPVTSQTPCSEPVVRGAPCPGEEAGEVGLYRALCRSGVAVCAGVAAIPLLWASSNPTRQVLSTAAASPSWVVL